MNKEISKEELDEILKMTPLQYILYSILFIFLILFILLSMGFIPMSVFGIETQKDTSTDCHPYQSPWGVICD